MIVTEARYPYSRCPICDEPIVEGERIAMVDDEWVHEGCVEDDDELVPA